MAKAAAGEASLKIGSDTYLFRLEVGEMMEIEEEFGKPFMVLMGEWGEKWGQEGAPRIKDLIEILPFVIYSHDLDADAIGKLLTKDFMGVCEAFTKCLKRTTDIDKGKSKPPGKPKPAANRKARRASKKTAK